MYRLCIDHFEDSFVISKGDRKQKLTSNAYPTIFEVPDKSGNYPQPRMHRNQNKQIKDENCCRFCLRHFLPSDIKIELNDVIIKDINIMLGYQVSNSKIEDLRI